MIIVIDTNAYYRDVYAEGQDLTTLFEAAAGGELDQAEIWTPKGVVEELVRQFSERTERMAKVLGEIKHDLSSFGINRPDVPSSNAAATAEYRARIEGRLDGPSRIIAQHPPDSGRVVEWAAQHRHPIKAQRPQQPKKGERDLSVFEQRKTAPVFGVVDSAIWLTVIEAARRDENVVLITTNRKDFGDPADPRRPCAQLREDLQAAGIDPERVAICPSVFDFNQENIPAEVARAEALEFLGDAANAETVKTEISDAVSWFPLELGADWGLGVEVDDSTLASFEPRELEFVRADPGPGGYFMTLWAEGDARFDLGIWKYDASDIPDDGPISVYDWDWNESMVAAEAELPARLLVEVRVRDGDIAVSIEDVEPA